MSGRLGTVRRRLVIAAAEKAAHKPNNGPAKLKGLTVKALEQLRRECRVKLEAEPEEKKKPATG